MTTRIGIDFGTANTVVARWDEDRDRAEPVALDGVGLTREAGRGVHQQVIPSLLAYSHRGPQRWLGARVALRPELLTDPDVAVFTSTKSSVTGPRSTSRGGSGTARSPRGTPPRSSSAT